MDQPKITLNTWIEKDSIIHQRIDIMGQATEKVVNVGEEHIRQLLRNLGWIPPEEPIRMELTCPSCCQPHIDEDERENISHKTHQCQICGYEWRPSNHPTVGVEKL